MNSRINVTIAAEKNVFINLLRSSFHPCNPVIIRNKKTKAPIIKPDRRSNFGKIINKARITIKVTNLFVEGKEGLAGLLKPSHIRKLAKIIKNIANMRG